MASLLILPGMLVVLLAHYYYQNLSQNGLPTLRFKKAMEVLHTTLASHRDLTQHHFQPCEQCGFVLALQQDPLYCIKSDAYKLLHPRSVLEDVVVFRDYAGPDLARQLIRQEWYDALPSMVQNGRFNITWLWKLPLDTSVLYPYAKNYFRTHRLGSMAGCLFQKYAHIPGQDEIALKTNQSIHFTHYIQKLTQQKKPAHCIEDAKYQKHTFKLWHEPECRELFDILDSDEYQEKYIFKTNRHLGNGIMVLDPGSEAQLRQWYRNGDLCGTNRSGSIVQEYVTNPYLYKGHKMEFRAYFSIASTNPPTLYGYKIALIKQCALPFDLNNPTKQVHVCNTAITKQHNDQGGKQGDDDHYIDWNLEELQELLLAEKRITSPTWLDDYLRPQIYRKVTHMYLSVKDYMFSDSRVGEFFGVDFIMDDNLRLWIFECNRNPNFLAVTEGRMNKFSGLISDMINLWQLYIKSKYQRIRKFIDTRMFSDPSRKFTKPLQDEFMSLQEDYLEDEYQLPPTSNLQLAYVESTDDGRYKYKRQVPIECLPN